MSLLSCTRHGNRRTETLGRTGKKKMQSGLAGIQEWIWDSGSRFVWVLSMNVGCWWLSLCLLALASTKTHLHIFYKASPWEEFEILLMLKTDKQERKKSYLISVMIIIILKTEAETSSHFVITSNRVFSCDVMMSSNMAASIAMEINIHLWSHARMVRVTMDLLQMDCLRSFFLWSWWSSPPPGCTHISDYIQMTR